MEYVGEVFETHTFRTKAIRETYFDFECSKHEHEAPSK